MNKRKRDAQQFVAKADGKGGLIIPARAMKNLNGFVTIDGVSYPFIVYKRKQYPVIKLSQGWTIWGGEAAADQHDKNVAALTGDAHAS